ncbi:MAG: efflux RND transporter periplasmic adaptor subunit [Phycisphaerales bacterium]|nr:efflux RND transporter periplasmic adaptor subunit [Phycisphaerales bacterium]
MSPTESRPSSTAPGTPPRDTVPSRTPPRSISWRVLLSFVAVAVAAGWIGTRYGDRIGPAVRDLATRLRPASKAAEAPASEHSGAATTQYYTCGMHPWVILPHPGDCPICHMTLTPLDPSKFTGEVTIDPVVVQNIGVRIEPVTVGPLVRTLRTVGTVDYDETRVRDVNTKVSGWIERLDVDYVGAPVAQGQALFDVYSPALFQAQEEYLLALRTQRSAADSNDRSLGPPLDLVESARTKLELYDVTPEQIEELVRAGKPSRTMTVQSPHGGVVIAKHANEGMRVDPGMQVFRIADLSRVWVIVTLYESQLPFVSEGQRGVMTLPYIPGQSFEGRVVYVYPFVDTKTREVQVRLEFDNPTGLLKPGMFATVELQSTLRRDAVLAPRSAIIRTGARNIAFVSLAEGRFEPRQVRLGIETGEGKVEILEGLAPGELVVTSGQFLLDSESRVREALAKMIKGELASDQQAQVATAGRSELDALPAPVASALTEALDAYFALGERLASDDPSGLAEPARAIAEALDRAIGTAIPADEQFWSRHTEAAVARGAAIELVATEDLDAARAKFADLSLALDSLIRATGVPPALPGEVQALHCPMFREGQGGATWLLRAGPVRNPFFGSTMLECFDRREALPVTGAAPPDGEAPAASPAPAAPTSSPLPGRASLGPDAVRAIDALLVEYLAAQDLLTKNNSREAAEALARVRTNAKPLSEWPGELGASARRIESALDVPSAADPAALRERFATVSDALLVIVAAVPPSSRAGGMHHAYCPMVKAHWIQAGTAIRNPYDPDMLECGTIKGRIDDGGTP